MFKDSLYSQFIFTSRYARYIDSKNRRETWPETVKRYFDFIGESLKEKHDYDIAPYYDELYNAVLDHDIMPSMRALMTAGPAAKKNHVALYNCAYLPMDDMKSFDEEMAILMSGTGVGYSVESDNVKQLPELPDTFFESDTTIIFDDSRLGWSKGYREFLSLLMIGQIPKWDVSKLRPAGARLKTMGGRSSGPEPLVELLRFTINVFKKAAGRRLTTLEAHDIACKVADIVVVGGVRRCLRKDSRIQTLGGYKEIQDLNIGDILISRGNKQKVIEKIYSGKQNTYDIHHKFGILKGVTENHEVAIFDDMYNYLFKSVKDLNENDVLVWDSFGNVGSSQTLPIFEQNTHFNSKEDIIFPKLLNVDLAWLFGLIQGDGYIGPKSIEISGNIDDYEMLAHAKDLFAVYFNIKGNLDKDSHKGKGIRLRINSISLATWCFNNLKQSDTPIKIPDYIFNSTKEERCAYLAGVFDSDGRITPDGGVDQVTTIYSSFKNDLITLLSTLGIGAAIFFKNNDKRRGKGVKAKDYWTVRIKGKINRNKWEEIIEYSHSIKKNLLFEYIGKNNDFSWPKFIHGSQGYRADMAFSESLERGMTTDQGIYPSSIKKIVLSNEEEDTYDIETESHEFTVEGIIVHNSALISLSDLNDDRMRDAKSGTWWKTNPYRRLANNSAVYNEKPDMGVFMKEWLSLYESHSGERGIVSRKAIRRVIDNANEYRSINFEDAPLRETNHEFGVNPCLHPDSMVETIHGRVKIKDIKEPTMVYSMDKNGKLCIRNSSASWISKKKANTLKITISSCKELICTPDHKIYVEGRGWLEAQNIKIGDRVVHLTRNRRGAAYSGVKLTTQTKQEIVMEHRLVFEAYYGKIPVGYDVHHIDGDTYNNDIDNLECLSHEDHARLTGIEQPNNHGVVGYNDKCVNNIGFISPENSRHGAKVIIPIPEDLKSNLHQYANVISIQEGPITDVYDLSVEDTHNFIADFIVVHNCAEIILRPYEFCNLTSVQIYEDDSKQSILNKIKLATILGTFQSCFTDFKYLKKKWQRNCEEERLLGVSLNGVFDNGWTNGQAYENNEFDENAQFDFENFRTSMKAEAIRTNMKVAKEIGINASVAITCIKPEGTSSAFNGTSSGFHPSYSPTYVRYVRNDLKDPLTKFMMDAGFPWETDVMDPKNVVCFKFPIKSAPGSIGRKEISAIEHLELWLAYQKDYCEHKPSVTISVKEDEWLEVGAWVYKNFEWMSGVSFLPAEEGDTVYQQAPFTECNSEEYESLVAKMPQNVDWSSLVEFEKEDSTTNTRELACTSATGCFF